jgi:leucine dehydrogenase
MSTFEQMTERGHERVCFHRDRETGLRAIIAIHSTVLGNALGGTRRWHYASEASAVYDVLRLSEGMTYKAAAASLPMGGGKSVILLPRKDHRATEAEGRAMGRFVHTFHGQYIAAEDVGVDPQFVDWMALETRHVMGGVKLSAGGDPSPFTARGVVNGMKACLAFLGLPVDFGGLTVAIQGVGHVGSNVARILHEAGARLVVADLNAPALNRAVTELGARAVGPEEILSTPCDILCPCALGGVINANLARSLRCRIVCGAANNVLDDPFEDAVVLKNADIVYGPDFVVNSGGLIRLAGLYLEMTEAELEAKYAAIETTTLQVLRQSETLESAHAAAIALARDRIAQGARAARGTRWSEQVYAG